MATANTAIRQTIKRVKSAWAEMDYAQQRLFEIRTGVPVISPDQAVGPAASVDELEALYELDEDKLAA